MDKVPSYDWSEYAFNERQAEAIRCLDKTQIIHSIVKRDTALPHLEVETLSGDMLRVWPSGRVETAAR